MKNNPWFLRRKKKGLQHVVSPNQLEFLPNSLQQLSFPNEILSPEDKEGIT